MTPGQVTDHEPAARPTWLPTARIWLSLLGAVAVTAAVAVPSALLLPARRSNGPGTSRTADAKGLPWQTTEPHGTPVSDFGGSGPNMWATTADGRLYVSTNSGTTWSAASTPVPLAEPQRTVRELIASDGLYGPYGITVSGTDVWLVSPSHGADVLFETGDDGKTWSRARSLPGAPRGDDDVFVQLLTTRDGVVTVLPPGNGTGQLDVSTDGGSSFLARTLPQRGAVHFVSPTVGFLVTSTGSGLYETLDAGVTWRRLTVHPSGVPDDFQVGFPLWATSGWVVVPVTVTDAGVGSLYTVAADQTGGATLLGHLVAASSMVVSSTGDKVFLRDGLLAYTTLQSWTKWTATPQTGLPGGWAVDRAVAGYTGWWVLSEVRRTCPHRGTCTLEQVLYRVTGTEWQPITLRAPPRHPTEGGGTPRLRALSFLSPTVGYGAFTDDGNCSVDVARTTDGGDTFTSPVEVGTCSRSGGVGAITFDDSGDGFVFSTGSPLLYESHDSGRTWTSQLEVGDVAAVEAVGSSVWLLLANCPPGGSWPTARSTCPLVVRESTDGGRTWHTSASRPEPVPAPETRGQEEKLTRVGPSSAYVLGTPNTNGKGAPATAPIWFTDDSGRSWTLRHLQCDIDALSARLAVAPTGTLFGICAGDPGMGLQDKTVAVSKNGGLTWTHPGPHTAQLGASSGLGGGYLGEIDAVSATTVYFSGDRSGLYETRDGGATWSTDRGPTDGAGGPSTLAFFGGDGVALADGSLWQTTDAGTMWTQVTPVVQRQG